MTILVDYVCGPVMAVEPRDHPVFYDLTQARDEALPKRVGLGRAVTLVGLIGAPCELRVRRRDLSDEFDRDVLAGILAGTHSTLIMCDELADGRLIRPERRLHMSGKSAMLDDLAVMHTPGDGPSIARGPDELGDLVRQLRDGLGLSYRLAAVILSQVEQQAIGGAAALNEQYARRLARASEELATPEDTQWLVERVGLKPYTLDLAEFGEPVWADYAAGALFLSRLNSGRDVLHIVVPVGLPMLTPVRWAILSRLAESTGGTIEGQHEDDFLASEDVMRLDAAVDFIRNVAANDYMLMIPHPGEGTGVLRAIQLLQRQNPRMTLERIADKLNEMGYPARRSGEWWAASVRDVIKQTGLPMPQH